MSKTKIGVLLLTGCMVIALCACGNQNPVEGTSGPMQIEAEDVVGDDTKETEESFSLGEITLELQDIAETAQVYAVITCEKGGAQVWQHTTSTYYVGQVDTIEEIGVHNGMYYFCEQGTVTALDVQTGEIIWQNKELGGAGVAYDFDEAGTLYISGYFGPDLMMIDKNGQTVKRIVNLDAGIHYWPFQLDYDEGYVYVTFEAYDDWTWDEKSYPDGHVLSYKVSDGSIGVEHNATEQSPAFGGFHQSLDYDEMRIDYLGDDTYLLNLRLFRVLYMSNVTGHRVENVISFECNYENGFFYKGQLEHTGSEIVLTISETTDPNLWNGATYYFQ